MAQNWTPNQNATPANFGGITYSGMPAQRHATPPTPIGGSGSWTQHSGMGDNWSNGAPSGGWMGHTPHQQPQQQLPAEWQTWLGARPQRPEGGFDSRDGWQAYRTSVQDWWGQNPAMPAINQYRTALDAWRTARPAHPADGNWQDFRSQMQDWRQARPSRPDIPFFGMGLGRLGGMGYGRGLFSALMDRFGRG